MKSRLFYKIFATYLVLVLLAVAVVELFLAPHLRDTLTRSLTEKMIGHGRIIALMAAPEMTGQVKELAARAEARVTIIDAAGRVRADSQSPGAPADNHLNRTEVQEARLKGQGIATRFSRTLGENMVYVAVVIGEREQLRGYVRLARSLADVSAAVDRLYRLIYLTLFLISLPSLLLAFWFARNITAPICRMAAFTGKIREGQRPGSLLVDSGDELAQLARDINAILEAQDEKVRLATAEKSKLEAAFASMVEGALTLDTANRIDQFNRSLRKMTGKRYEDILGKTPLEAFRSVELQDALTRFRADGRPVRQEIVIGEDRPRVIGVNITAIRGFPGAEPKILMMFHDVTRIKQLERMRMDFIANVTHEIRTPLTAISGYVETLQQGAVRDREQAHKFLQTIADNAQRLNRLVDDLLTLSNIELGEARLNFERLAAAEMIAAAWQTVAPRREKKRITAETTVSPATLRFCADRDRTMQVLLNVLDNAVKYTPEGGEITVTAGPDKGETGEEKTGVEAEAVLAVPDKDGGPGRSPAPAAVAPGAGGPENFVVIRIADTGPGIPKSELPRLGERFYRVDKTRSRELGGTGLGLSIVKHLMAAHGGRMEIDSTPGRGTTVSLYFPANL